MFQPELIHESVFDALRDAVRALGGAKAVGPMLWPARPVEEARNRLNDCLNPQRAEKFSLFELLLILRRAREAGYHGAIGFIATECGYAPPTPVDPADERAELQRTYVESVKQQRLIADRLERLAQQPTVRAVA